MLVLSPFSLLQQKTLKRWPENSSQEIWPLYIPLPRLLICECTQRAFAYFELERHFNLLWRSRARSKDALD